MSENGSEDTRRDNLDVSEIMHFWMCNYIIYLKKAPQPNSQDEEILTYKTPFQKLTLLQIILFYIVFQVRPSEALTSSHYPCTCIKELWILLIQLLDHRNKGSNTEVKEEYFYICSRVTKCSHIVVNAQIWR